MSIVEGSFGSKRVGDLTTTARIARNSLSRNFPKETPEHLAVFRESLTTELELPINTEEDILDGVVKIANERNLAQLPIDYSAPYWAPTQRYNPQHIIQAIVQYPDFHPFPLAKSAFPPEEDAREFQDKVKASEKPLTIPEQLDIALDISGNNITGAANLAAFATRAGARGYERKAYPGIDMNPDELRKWQHKVAQFEVYDNSGLMDAPGDTYYFWTHVYGALAYESLGGLQSRLSQHLLDVGTPLMKNVRKYIAGRPIQTPHHEASVIGRNIGLALAELIDVKPH